MFDIFLRELKDKIFFPLTRKISWIHPSVFSFLGFAAGISCALLLYRQCFKAGFFFWILNRVLDGVDGAVARYSGRESDLGGYLDIVSDFAVYALVPLALAAGSGDREVLMYLSFMLASFYVNAASWMYLSAILEKRGRDRTGAGESTSITMPRGLIGGAETLLLYSLFIIMNEYLALFFIFTAVLVMITAAQRIIWALRFL